MNNQITSPNSPAITNPSNLTSTVQDLSTSLTAIAPQNSETTQLITYTLIGVALTGIMVYSYIKSQESLC